MNDPVRRALARRIRVFPSDEFQRGQEHEWPAKFQARVAVTLTSGRTLTEEVDVFPAGSQMTDEQVAAKFRDVAGRVLPPDRVAGTIDKVVSIDRQTTVSELIQSVCL